MISAEARKLAEAMVAAKIITAEQLQGAIEAASKENSPSLIVGLLEQGLLTFKVFEKFVSGNLGIRSAILADHVPDKDVINQVGGDFIQSRYVFPIAARNDKSGKSMALGMVDPLDQSALKYVETKTGYRVVPFLISLPDFKRAAAQLPHRPEVNVTTANPASREEFIVIRPGGYEEEMGGPNREYTGKEGTGTESKTVQPKPQWESERAGGTQSSMFVKNEQKLQVDLIGPNKSKFKEEVLAKIDLNPVEARRLTEKKYSREVLYSHLKNVSPADLQKAYNEVSPDLKVEALANALIRAGVITKNDMLISTAVSLVFSEE